jgi:hypothetical protein
MTAASIHPVIAHVNLSRRIAISWWACFVAEILTVVEMLPREPSFLFAVFTCGLFSS